MMRSLYSHEMVQLLNTLRRRNRASGQNDTVGIDLAKVVLQFSLGNTIQYDVIALNKFVIPQRAIQPHVLQKTQASSRAIHIHSPS